MLKTVFVSLLFIILISQTPRVCSLVMETYKLYNVYLAMLLKLKTLLFLSSQIVSWFAVASNKTLQRMHENIMQSNSKRQLKWINQMNISFVRDMKAPQFTSIPPAVCNQPVVQCTGTAVVGKLHGGGFGPELKRLFNMHNARRQQTGESIIRHYTV